MFLSAASARVEVILTLLVPFVFSSIWLYRNPCVVAAIQSCMTPGGRPSGAVVVGDGDVVLERRSRSRDRSRLRSRPRSRLEEFRPEASSVCAKEQVSPRVQVPFMKPRHIFLDLPRTHLSRCWCRSSLITWRGFVIRCVSRVSFPRCLLLFLLCPLGLVALGGAFRLTVRQLRRGLVALWRRL